MELASASASADDGKHVSTDVLAHVPVDQPVEWTVEPLGPECDMAAVEAASEAVAAAAAIAERDAPATTATLAGPTQQDGGSLNPDQKAIAPGKRRLVVAILLTVLVFQNAGQSLVAAAVRKVNRRGEDLHAEF